MDVQNYNTATYASSIIAGASAACPVNKTGPSRVPGAGEQSRGWRRGMGEPRDGYIHTKDRRVVQVLNIAPRAFHVESPTHELPATGF